MSSGLLSIEIKLESLLKPLIIHANERPIPVPNSNTFPLGFEALKQ